jgi:hypothetical protein
MDLLNLYLNDSEKYAFTCQVIMAKRTHRDLSRGCIRGKQRTAVFVKKLWNNDKGSISDE